MEDQEGKEECRTSLTCLPGTEVVPGVPMAEVAINVITPPSSNSTSGSTAAKGLQELEGNRQYSERRRVQESTGELESPCASPSQNSSGTNSLNVT